MKKKILIFNEYYLPGVKGGGPIQSIKNIVDNLNSDFEFYIVSSDRDLGDDIPFHSVEVNKWIKKENANLMYVNSGNVKIWDLLRIIKEINPEVIYLNSFFSKIYSINIVMLYKLRLLKGIKLILAPRGEFSKGALLLKTFKKKTFIKLAKITNMYNKIIWHSTSDMETQDIIRQFGSKAIIKQAGNLIPSHKTKLAKNIIKNKGTINIIFISRIHPKKNLQYALEVIKELKGEIKLEIFGPIEDGEYWVKCQNLIKEMPNNVKVKYNGVIEQKNVFSKFHNSHLFLFPTLGENFGHVIVESLLAGCPVIISDQTPWKDLNIYNAGWELSLNRRDLFITKVQKIINMDQIKYEEMIKGTQSFIKDKVFLEKEYENTKKLFSKV